MLHHPACPESTREKIVDRVVGKTWDSSIGSAVGISMQNYVRHELTEYDRLYRLPGLTKDEARLIIKVEVNEIIAGWKVSLTTSLKSHED